MARLDGSQRHSVTSPALVRVLPQLRVWHGVGQPLLLVALTTAFLVSAVAFLAPELGDLAARLRAPAVGQTVGPPPSLSRSEVETVLGYARQMRADDTLVQVRPGVLAKRSNVQGVEVGGRTVYYDVLPHQSYGPLRAGKLGEADVAILAQEQVGDTLVLVYVPKKAA